MALLSAALLLGCGGDGAETDAGRVMVAGSCSAVATDHGLVGVFDVMDRVAAGEEVTLDEMSQLFNSPVYDRWRRSYTTESVSPTFLGRMLMIALRGEDALSERMRAKSQRTDVIRSFHESAAEKSNIMAAIDEIAADDVLCRAFDELSGWIPAESFPDTLKVDFVLGYPEIRLYEDHLMVDAGLAWACGHQQLTRFIASTLYSDLATIPGPQPRQTKGENILLESLRAVRNLTAPAMIEQLDSIVFDRRHDMLGGGVVLEPSAIYNQGYRTLLSLDLDLTRVRDLDQSTDEDWLGLYRLFIGAQSWKSTAWYMGRIIEDRLGREALQESLATVADFWATYQQACLARENTSDEHRGTEQWYIDMPPPFTAENAEWLESRLRARFH